MINPTKLIGWRVLRTWPSLQCAAAPILRMEYLEAWPVSGWCADFYAGRKWHDGYVDKGSKYERKATVFKSYEEALEVLKEVAPRWKGSVFMIEALQEG